jgi:hypothetical protein
MLMKLEVEKFHHSLFYLPNKREIWFIQNLDKKFQVKSQLK